MDFKFFSSLILDCLIETVTTRKCEVSNQAFIDQRAGTMYAITYWVVVVR